METSWRTGLQRPVFICQPTLRRRSPGGWKRPHVFLRVTYRHRCTHFVQAACQCTFPAYRAFVKLKHLRSAQWRPELISRMGYDEWQASGSTSLLERVRAKLQQILQAHQPLPIPADQAREIQKRVDEFRWYTLYLSCPVLLEILFAHLWTKTQKDQVPQTHRNRYLFFW